MTLIGAPGAIFTYYKGTGYYGSDTVPDDE